MMAELKSRSQSSPRKNLQKDETLIDAYAYFSLSVVIMKTALQKKVQTNKTPRFHATAIRVPTTLYKTLKTASKKTAISVNSIVNTAILELMKKESKWLKVNTRYKTV